MVLMKLKALNNFRQMIALYLAQVFEDVFMELKLKGNVMFML